MNCLSFANATEEPWHDTLPRNESDDGSSLEDAMDKFYNSPLLPLLHQEDDVLYVQSPAFLYDLMRGTIIKSIFSKTFVISNFAPPKFRKVKLPEIPVFPGNSRKKLKGSSPPCLKEYFSPQKLEKVLIKFFVIFPVIA